MRFDRREPAGTSSAEFDGGMDPLPSFRDTQKTGGPASPSYLIDWTNKTDSTGRSSDHPKGSVNRSEKENSTRHRLDKSIDSSSSSMDHDDQRVVQRRSFTYTGIEQIVVEIHRVKTRIQLQIFFRSTADHRCSQCNKIGDEPRGSYAHIGRFWWVWNGRVVQCHCQGQLVETERKCSNW